MNTAVRRKTILTSTVCAVLVIAVGITVAIALQARAATIAVLPGVDTLQAAIDTATDGDTLTLGAGDYIGDVSYNSGKSLTFIGTTGTIVKPGSTTMPNFTAANAQSVTLKNISFDGDAVSPADKTGLDLNSISNITLENITVKNYARNGVSITASYDAGPGGDFSATAVKSAVLTNVTTNNTGWAGIALYEAGVGPYLDLSGVVFAGVTTVSNSQYGIQIGKSPGSSATSVSGPDAVAIDLGHVIFAGNMNNISGGSTIPAYIATTSTIDGQPITAALVGSNVIIGSLPVVEDPSIPGVPNTAAAQQ